jgi:hypothetical protein
MIAGSATAEIRSSSATPLPQAPDASRMARIMERKALVVVGPHRSGTSAITRTCSLLGAALPRNLMTPQADNKFGYWESIDLVAANDDILGAMRSSWDDVRPLNDEWFASDLFGQWVVKLRRVIEAEYAGQNFFVMKDPRLARLLPVLLPTLRAMSIKPHVIIAVRNPLEVARSLRERDKFSEVYGLLLWLSDILSAELYSRQVARAVIGYARLLKDWRREFTRLGGVLSIDWPVSFAGAAAEIDQFLQGDLRHQRAKAELLFEPARLPSLIRELYRELIAASKRPAQDIAPACDRARATAAQWIAVLEPFLPFMRRPDEVRLKSESDARLEQLAEAQQRLTECFTGRMLPLEAEHAAREEQVNTLTREAAEAAERLAQAEQQMAAMQEELGRAQTTLLERDQEVQARTAQAEQELVEQQRRIDALEPEAAELRDGLAQAHSQISELEADAAAATQSLTRVQHELATASDRLAEAERDLAQRQIQIDALTRQAEQQADMGRRQIAELAEQVAQAVAESRQQDQRNCELVRGFTAAAVARIDEEIAERDRHTEALREQTAAEIRGRDQEIVRLSEQLGATAAQYRTGIESLLRRVRPRMRQWKKLRYRSIFSKRSENARRVWQECKSIARSRQFDPAYYLANNPDLLTADIDPLLHFVVAGASEGRNPSPDFDTRWYLAANPDLVAWKGNPLVHYIRHGSREGRAAAPLKLPDAGMSGAALPAVLPARRQ